MNCLISRLSLLAVMKHCHLGNIRPNGHYKLMPFSSSPPLKAHFTKDQQIWQKNVSICNFEFKIYFTRKFYTSTSLCKICGDQTDSVWFMSYKIVHGSDVWIWKSRVKHALGDSDSIIHCSSGPISLTIVQWHFKSRKIICFIFIFILAIILFWYFICHLSYPNFIIPNLTPFSCEQTDIFIKLAFVYKLCLCGRA